MSTTELKATPWYHGGDYIYDANEQPVFSLEFGSAEELTERADYVVRAVNSHADMLEALELARTALVESVNYGEREPSTMNAVWRISAALDKAKGIA